MAYAPEENVFYFSDGSQFSPRTFRFFLDAWHEVPEYIFCHWWSDLSLETMKRGVEETYPITKWTLIPYFGSILVMSILAMAAIFGGMTGLMSKAIVVALVGAIAVLGYDSNRGHQWLLRREAERRTVRFDVSDMASAAVRPVWPAMGVAHMNRRRIGRNPIVRRDSQLFTVRLD